MSVALHAVVAVVVLRVRSKPLDREPIAPPEPAQPAQPAEPKLVEIEFLPAPPPASPAVGPLGEAPQRLALQDHVHATRAETAASTAAPTAAAPPGRSLAMRRAVDLTIHELHGGGAVRAAPNSERPIGPAVPLAQPAAPDSGEPDPKQTHEAFAMDSEPDGTAHLHDTRNLRWVLGLPTKGDIRNRIDAWQDELAEAYSGKAKDYCTYPERPIEHPIGSIGTTIMKFDVTDWAMRRHGDDPYASAKLAQLDATRPGRAQRGAMYRHAELSRASDLMERNLEQLWATVPDAAERKRELFALWDECDETGSSDVVEATDHARKRVLKFVREHLPPGSHEAFTDAELAALNRDKQSHASFAPYADGIE
jgi:hypothetical protein